MDYERRNLICTSENQKTTGFVYRRDLSTGERVLKAGKVGGLLWLIAGFSIFIPILHFVLVPGFLLAGLIFAAAAGYSRAEISDGEFTCPNCGKVQKLRPMAESFPYVVRCEGCSFTLKLDLEKAPTFDERH